MESAMRKKASGMKKRAHQPKANQKPFYKDGEFQREGQRRGGNLDRIRGLGKEVIYCMVT